MRDLQLPARLVQLVEDGWWPTGDIGASVRAQNREPLVPSERIAWLFPGEWLLLFPPPFSTVESLRPSNGRFWDSPYAGQHEIDPALSLVIGDCGLGSDAPIILDYRSTPPCVRRLSPRPDGPDGSRVGGWDAIADDFNAFVASLGLGDERE